jgi:prephenate dehydratase
LLPEGRNTFRFFIDLEFDSVTNYRRLLKKLSSSCLRLQIMGEYAKQDLPT